MYPDDNQKWPRRGYVLAPSTGTSVACPRRDYDRRIACRVVTTSRRVALRANDAAPVYLLADQPGSTGVLVSRTGQALTRQYFYPYGGNRGGAVSELTTVRYTGRRQEDGLPGGEGLYDYGARWYDARLGRFNSPDSIVPEPGDPQALNRYAYSHNNALRYTDPSGHCPMCITAGIGAFVGAGIAYGSQVARNVNQNGWSADALISDISLMAVAQGAVAGALVGATALVAAPMVVAGAGEAIAGVGVAIGSTRVLAAGLGASTAAGEMSNAVYGAPLVGQPSLDPRLTAPEANLPASKMPNRARGNRAALDDHFAGKSGYGADFGARTANEYADMASDFLQNSQRNGYNTLVDAKGMIRVYDKSTNTFGAYNPDGTTRTFFKPTSPTYWERNSPNWGSCPWTPDD